MGCPDARTDCSPSGPEQGLTSVDVIQPCMGREAFSLPPKDAETSSLQEMAHGDPHGHLVACHLAALPTV